MVILYVSTDLDSLLCAFNILSIVFNWKNKHSLFWQNRTLVRLYRSGNYIPCTRQRNPTTARRWRFELLDVSPGPYRTYLDNLATLGSPRVSMLTPSLVRTPVQRVTKCTWTPVLKPSSKSDLPCAWITAPATDASRENRYEISPNETTT